MHKGCILVLLFTYSQRKEYQTKSRSESKNETPQTLVFRISARESKGSVRWEFESPSNSKKQGHLKLVL